jgi:hypothetical protein
VVRGGVERFETGVWGGGLGGGMGEEEGEVRWWWRRVFVSMG